MMVHTRAVSAQLSALVLVFAGMFAMGGVTSAADQKGVFTAVPDDVATTYQTITSAGPLNQIFVGVDAAAQIAHTGDSAYEVFPPSTIPGDFGTLVVVNDALYAPDFANHGGTASAGIGSYTAFTPISQSAVSGSGSSTDPFSVTTAVGVGSTGLTITQVDTYVVGEEQFRTDVTLTNAAGNDPVSALVYRAADCYLGGSDSGYGFVTGTGVGCASNADNSPPARIEQLLPLTAGNNYYEAGYSEVWAAIGTHQPFNNTCRCADNIDNGAGISWTVDVPAGGNVTLSNMAVFSPTGGTPPPPPTVTAAPTLGIGMLALLGLLLFAVGLYSSRRHLRS